VLLYVSLSRMCCGGGGGFVCVCVLEGVSELELAPSKLAANPSHPDGIIDHAN